MIRGNRHLSRLRTITDGIAAALLSAEAVYGGSRCAFVLAFERPLARRGWWFWFGSSIKL